MQKVSHKPFKVWLKQQNTHSRVQPAMGTKLESKQTILCIYHTPKPSFWQRVRGWIQW